MSSSFDVGTGTEVDVACHTGWQWDGQLNSKTDTSPTKGWDKLSSSSSVVIEGGRDGDDDDDDAFGVPLCGFGRGEMIRRDRIPHGGDSRDEGHHLGTSGGTDRSVIMLRKERRPIPTLQLSRQPG
eukprot:788227-Amphidinium_carterae.2